MNKNVHKRDKSRPKRLYIILKITILFKFTIPVFLSIRIITTKNICGEHITYLSIPLKNISFLS